MRLHNAKHIGNGVLIGGIYDGETRICLASGGSVREQTLGGGSKTVCYGNAYAPVLDGGVTVKGGLPVYERK